MLSGISHREEAGLVVLQLEVLAYVVEPVQETIRTDGFVKL